MVVLVVLFGAIDPSPWDREMGGTCDSVELAWASVWSVCLVLFVGVSLTITLRPLLIIKLWCFYKLVYILALRHDSQYGKQLLVRFCVKIAA